MNRTKIEYVPWTWNPITGCRRLCDFDGDGRPDCYAYRIYQRFGWDFEPRFHWKRLKQPLALANPAMIFLCSVADFYAPWIPQRWRDEVHNIMVQTPHTYLVLTKYPENIPHDLTWLPIWIGTTVTRQSEIDRIIDLRCVDAKLRYVSFEPLLEQIQFDLSMIGWVIIGKLTGSGNKIPFQRPWVLSLLNQARSHKIPVFIKNNVRWSEKIQEFPMEAHLT